MYMVIQIAYGFLYHHQYDGMLHFIRRKTGPVQRRRRQDEGRREHNNIKSRRELGQILTRVYLSVIVS